MPKQHQGALSFVVLGNGVGLTKGFGLHRPASFFAEAGFAALAFDYRTWGSSGNTFLMIARRHAWSFSVQLCGYIHRIVLSAQ
jgi:predicted alpha/beta hydrolase